MPDLPSTQPILNPAAPAPAAHPALGEPRRMSSAARILGAFYSPTATFEDIARQPHFILCWVVMIVASIFANFSALHRIGRLALARQLITASPRAQALPADQLQKQITGFAKFLPLQLYVVTPALFIIMLLVLAGIFLAAENFLLGQETKYKGMLAVVSHALLPLTLYILAGAAVLWLKPDPATTQFQNMLGSNPAFYFSAGSLGPVLKALLTRLDLFSFWAIGLLALGLVKLGKKVKYGGALSVVVGLWVVYVLILVGVAAIA